MNLHSITASKNYWEILNQANKNSDWKKITQQFLYNENIDVDYVPPEEEITILFITVLNAQFELVTRMLCRKPNANFTIIPKLGPHANKSIPLLVANGKQRPLMAHIVASDQQIDYSIGPVEGLSTFWIMTNYRWWELIETVLGKSFDSLPINISPNHPETQGLTPLSIAVNAGRKDIVKKMQQYLTK